MTSTPNITNVKPTISLHREGPITYWTLTMHDGVTDLSYDLRVRHVHDSVGDTFRLFVVNRAEHDDIELVSQDDLEDRLRMHAEHEVVHCDEHASQPPDPSDNDYCAACDMATAQHAYTEVTSKCRASITEREGIIATHLRQTWNAFALLFNPAVNL